MGGTDEIDETRGDGWAEPRPDGSLKRQICFHNADEANFIAMSAIGGTLETCRPASENVRFPQRTGSSRRPVKTTLL